MMLATPRSPRPCSPPSAPAVAPHAGSFQWLEKTRQDDPRVGILQLSRNFGHQIAITAGMDHANADAVVIIDADLQDPPEAIADLLDNPELSARLGQAGYERVHQHFTWKRAAEKTVQAYREAIRDHRRF